MLRTIAGVALLLMIAGAGCTQNTWHSQDVRVEFAFQPEIPQIPLLNPKLDVRPRISPFYRDIIQGEPVPVTFTITNTGDEPIILQRLELPCMPGVGYSWTHPVYGRLERDAALSAYNFYPDVNVKPTRSFSSGFLFPGEKHTVGLVVHFRDSGEVRQNLSLTYYRKDLADLAEEIYVPQNDPLAGTMRYVRPLTARLEDWRKARERFDDILLEGTGGEHVFSFGRDFDIRPVSFKYEAARQKIDFEPDDYDYSQWKEGWVFQKDGTLTIVTPGKTETYEGVTIDVFKFIEDYRGFYANDYVYSPVSVRLAEGTVPFHIASEETYKKVADLLADFRITYARGHRFDVPVDSVFALIKSLDDRGFHTVIKTFDYQRVLGLESIGKE